MVSVLGMHSCARLPVQTPSDSVYFVNTVDGVCSGHAIVVLVFLVHAPGQCLLC